MNDHPAVAIEPEPFRSFDSMPHIQITDEDSRNDIKEIELLSGSAKTLRSKSGVLAKRLDNNIFIYSDNASFEAEKTNAKRGVLLSMSDYDSAIASISYAVANSLPDFHTLFGLCYKLESPEVCQFWFEYIIPLDAALKGDHVAIVRIPVGTFRSGTMCMYMCPAWSKIEEDMRPIVRNVLKEVYAQPSRLYNMWKFLPASPTAKTHEIYHNLSSPLFYFLLHAVTRMLPLHVCEFLFFSIEPNLVHTANVCVLTQTHDRRAEFFDLRKCINHETHQLWIINMPHNESHQISRSNSSTCLNPNENSTLMTRSHSSNEALSLSSTISNDGMSVTTSSLSDSKRSKRSFIKTVKNYFVQSPMPTEINKN